MPDQEIINELLASEAVTSLLSADDAIRPGMLGDSDSLPAIVVKLVDTVPVNTAGGTDSYGTKFSRIQVDCWGNSYSDARALGDAVDGVLSGWSGGTGPIDMCHMESKRYNPDSIHPGDETVRHKLELDFLIQHV